MEVDGTTTCLVRGWHFLVFRTKGPMGHGHSGPTGPVLRQTASAFRLELVGAPAVGPGGTLLAPAM